jgi:hypothetical protein
VNCFWTQPASEGSGRFIGMVDNFMDILVSLSKIGLPDLAGSSETFTPGVAERWNLTSKILMPCAIT